MPDQPLSNPEIQRYARHFSLPKFGPETQQKLKAAKVLVIGAGGLGSPLLLYLAAAGVGTIGIVDYDVVDASNLQRQVLYSEHDLGKLKTEAAKARLEALNPHISIHTYNCRLNAENAMEIIEAYDVIADGTDNFPTRYLVNDACVLLDKPNVYAAIFQYEGQLSVFNWTAKNGDVGPNYRDLHPLPPAPGTVPNCAEAGVLGVLPGIIGALQASEVIKVVSGLGEPLSGRLFVFDTLYFESRTFKIKRLPENPLNGKQPSIRQLIDYEDFCGLKKHNPIKEISPEVLREWLANGEVVQLIDVREPAEYANSNIGGTLIPFASIKQRVEEIKNNGKVVLYCQSGKRSAVAVQELEAAFGLENLYSLTGGLLSYLALPKK